jgi:hypothetical protein
VKVVGLALGAITLALVAVLAAVAVQYGTLPSGADAAGFAIVTAVAGVLLVGLLYWPVLARLRRRPGGLSAARGALTTALGLNAPIYVALAVLGRDRRLFAGDEVLLLGFGVALLGVLFGAGYPYAHRKAAG